MKSDERPYYLMSKISKLRMLKMSTDMTPKEAEDANAWLEKFGSPTLVWVEDEDELRRLTE